MSQQIVIEEQQPEVYVEEQMPSEEPVRKKEEGMPNLKRIIQELGRGG